ncbi:HNH endonuclease [Pseudomonas sp. MD195_PC81_125]|uniref:HNH endonuclease signature motif containing protein n=1 Tax=Pseudomonas sp. MD195_PC81_125 TaxID=2741560 RepID=UPI0015F9B968|nr:HNH endonuclease signature motif containing protein [Pseudomonas sp. MD195_PC81_125]MBA5983357.1 HNH endonuclease [Pseudomonas sp. MD195_PC81_125]MBA5983641.1 HNH endonuclease [Pseudomonas sp. MD195_PC81_125]
MTKTRTIIPRALEAILLYKSAKTCCVCRFPRAPIQIHHIDQNPSNNCESNLVVLCTNCHDDAHTTRALSKNLTPARLSQFKLKWEADVLARSSTAMVPSSNLDQAMWTFVNHQRIIPVMNSLGVKFNKAKLDSLISRGVVDKDGIPTFQLPKKSPAYTDQIITIYDRFEWDDSMRLHNLYMDAVDKIILKANPIELGAVWTKTDIRSVVQPGSICFCMRGHMFKRGDVINGEENRLVFARSNNIEIQFHAHTRHMYGNSALYDSFVGSRFTASLIHVKDYAVEAGKLIIRATPISMGAGFVPSAYQTPRPLRYGWAQARKI